MADELLTDRLRSLVTMVGRLADERARAQTAADWEFANRTKSAEATHAQRHQSIVHQYEKDRLTLEQEYACARQTILAQFDSESSAALEEFESSRERIETQYHRARLAAKAEFREQRWEAQAVFEASRDGAKSDTLARDRDLAARVARLEQMRDEAATFLKACGQLRIVAREESQARPGHCGGQPIDCFDQATGVVERSLLDLKSQTAVRFFRGLRPVGIVAGLWLASLLLVSLAFDFASGLIAATVTSLAIAPALAYPFWMRMRRESERLYTHICQAIADAKASRRAHREQATGQLRRQQRQETLKRSQDSQSAVTQFRTQRRQLTSRYELAKQEMNEKYPRLLRELRQHRDDELSAIEKKYPALLADGKARFDEELLQTDRELETQKAEIAARYQTAWSDLEFAWKSGMRHVADGLADVARRCTDRFPDWPAVASTNWIAPRALPSVLRFGSMRLRLADMQHADPQLPRLAGDWPREFDLPAILEFPRAASLFFELGEAGRAVAELALQTVMLRLLTSLPPGKVRFTIIDPVGLGKSFAAFMHLADFEEGLVTSRIWTDLVHIEQRLASITEHMENVIQKYLRNVYQSIEEYNAEAGEVAEPFRFLVVANFPQGFSESAARRLVSIAGSGPRCGVYTLITVDRRLTLPQGITLDDVAQNSIRFRWQKDRFVWQDADLGRLPLAWDTPPDDEVCTRILQKVGEQAVQALRVEVPFEFVAPKPDNYWASDSRSGIDVPLGRAGATKRQRLQLGKGTSQHVLIAGKTGSGKSTLLHVLIANAALLYSPDELEMYLIDFKKGVEFKSYATHRLPHARVIAIESEREFGISVLERLDAELKSRGEKFRHAGVQDIAGYRDAQPNEIMPRILLIVDEFQEFFVEDDRVSQAAALLLDRLVRQGRAFGIHVLLGSQTLGGAYSLARSTVDQMAVRIALQCSDTDGHLVLSESNSAARLLSRPGEAIYNDANGLVEGNNPFQIVWLADDQRDLYVQQIAQRSHRREPASRADLIVFEGNAPADLANNRLLERAIGDPAAVNAAGAAAWLGEAVSIKAPTTALFRRQSGRNLLVLGQNDDLADGVLSAALVSLAAQHAPGAHLLSPEARFIVLDGSPADSPNAGYWQRVAERLPNPIDVASSRGAYVALADVAAIVERRRAADDDQAHALYLFICNLGRFRDLRRDDDEFGFGRSDETSGPTPSRNLRSILRDGPGLGVHTIVWCDSLNNLQRVCDRSSLREFEMRVLFQMSANDASALTDSPAASKLGPYRAIFSSEDEGYTEKFRPYAAATDAFLADAGRALRQRFAATPTTDASAFNKLD